MREFLVALNASFTSTIEKGLGAAVSFPFPGEENEKAGKQRCEPGVSKKLQRSRGEREGRRVEEKRNRLQSESIPNILPNSALPRTGSNSAI